MAGYLTMDVLWLLAAVVGAWAVYMALAMISARLESARAWRELRMQARRLRESQLHRLEQRHGKSRKREEVIEV